MGWVKIAREQTDEGMVVHEHHRRYVTEGRHGSYVMKYGDPLLDWDITVFDNTDDGIDEGTARAIADHAWKSSIYWSDDRLCHWMYDFNVGGHWCEGLFHNNGLPDDVPSIYQHLHINVYE